MVTRFYFDIFTDPTLLANTTPLKTSGWQLPATVTSWSTLRPKQSLSSLVALGNSSTAVPITTTQNILQGTFLSPAIVTGGLIAGTISLVIRAAESTLNANSNLAVVVSVLSGDYFINRGQLYSNFAIGTAFALTGSDATRIISAGALTPIKAYPGDHIMVEIGAHATSPTSSGTYSLRYGYSAASDFALTNALTTDLNPWCEFSQDLYGELLNNYKNIRADTGISVGERVR